MNSSVEEAGRTVKREANSAHKEPEPSVPVSLEGLDSSTSHQKKKCGRRRRSVSIVTTSTPPRPERQPSQERVLKSSSQAEADGAMASHHGAVGVFFTNVLPEHSPRGAVYALALVLTLASTFFFLSAGKSPPTSPFRCDDPTLQAPFLPDRLPTAQFLAMVTASGTAVVLLVEFRSNDASPQEASYLAARCLRRFYLGGLILGNVAFNIQKLSNAKRPHFIDSCRPAVFMPSGTEALVCQAALPSEASTSITEAVLSEIRTSPLSRFFIDSKDPTVPVKVASRNESLSHNSPGHTTALEQVTSDDSKKRDRNGATASTQFPPLNRKTTNSLSTNVMELTTTAGSGASRNATVIQGAPTGGSPGGSTDSRVPQDRGRAGLSPDGLVVDCHCSGPNSRKSGGSFPSGHASVAGFVFAFLFAHGFPKLWSFQKPLEAVALCVVLTACALLFCMQRLVYFHHHLIDVLFGFVLGAPAGALFALWPNMDGSCNI